MRVTVQLFAQARDLAEGASLSLELPQSPTVGQLRRALTRERPRLDAIAQSLLVAVDGDYAVDEEVIPDGADVACFPPVSGG